MVADSSPSDDRLGIDPFMDESGSVWVRDDVMDLAMDVAVHALYQVQDVEEDRKNRRWDPYYTIPVRKRLIHFSLVPRNRCIWLSYWSDGIIMLVDPPVTSQEERWNSQNSPEACTLYAVFNTQDTRLTNLMELVTLFFNQWFQSDVDTLIFYETPGSWGQNLVLADVLALSTLHFTSCCCGDFCELVTDLQGDSPVLLSLFGASQNARRAVLT